METVDDVMGGMVRKGVTPEMATNKDGYVPLKDRSWKIFQWQHLETGYRVRAN